MDKPHEQSPAPRTSPPPVPVYQETTTLREMWAFLRVRKKFWLAPIIITLLVLGLLMWLAGSAAVLSPFIYAL